MKPLKIQNNMAVAEMCRRSFYHFFLEFWEVIENEKLVPNFHIEYLCNKAQEYIERILRREPKKSDLVINIPPGSSKSTIFTIMLPAWMWVRDSSLRTISGSYAASLSLKHATQSRDIIRSDKYRMLFKDIDIKKDQDNKAYYKNTDGGDRISTSVGGSITGMHGHVIIIDDPIDPHRANSKVEIQKSVEWMKTTLSTRKVDKNISVTILVMQRLHEEDPTAHMINTGAEHICLPGEINSSVLIKPNILKERYVDGCLDPVRMPKKWMDEFYEDNGSFAYASQIMQSPKPVKGGIYKKGDFNIINDSDIPTLRDHGTDWDLAYTKTESNSASAFIESGKNEERMYITNLGFKWVEFPELVAWMKSRKAPHYIEKKASGKSAKQTLTRAGIHAEEVEVQSDKISRSKDASVDVENGRVFISRSVAETLFDDPKQGILAVSEANPDIDLNDAFTQSVKRHFGTQKATVGGANINF